VRCIEVITGNCRQIGQQNGLPAAWLLLPLQPAAHPGALPTTCWHKNGHIRAPVNDRTKEIKRQWSEWTIKHRVFPATTNIPQDVCLFELFYTVITAWCRNHCCSIVHSRCSSELCTVWLFSYSLMSLIFGQYRQLQVIYVCDSWTRKS